MEIGSITFWIFIVQVSLIPTHLFLYLTRRFDTTRLRFLVLSIVFGVFSTIWVFQELNPFVFGDILVLLTGAVLATTMLVYFSIELNLNIRKSILGSVFGISVLLILAKDIFASLNMSSLLYHLLFELLLLPYCARLVLNYSRHSQAERKKPMNIAAISFTYILAFSPIVTYIFTECYLKYLFVSSAYVLILLGYYTHYFRQMQFENSLSISTEKLNLKNYSRLRVVERYYLSENTFSEYDLNERELEVAKLLLSGSSYKEIAEQLFLDYSTIRGYASKVYSKTGIYGTKRLEKFKEKFGLPSN